MMTSDLHKPNGTGTGVAPQKQQKSHKRSLRACYLCRARKARCNMVDGAPCLNCRLNKVRCVVPERRRSRRQAQTNTEASKPETDRVDGLSKTLVVSSTDFLALLNGSMNPVDFMNSKSSMRSASICRVHNGGNHENLHFLECQKTDNGDQNRLLWPSSEYGQEETTFQQHLEGITNLEEAPFLGRHRAFSESPFVPQIEDCCLPAYIKPLPNGMNKDSLCYLQRTGVLSVPEKSLRNALLESYIEFVHPYMPVVELHNFIRIINLESRETISLILFQAVMFAGSAFVDMAQLNAAGYMSRKDARKALYQKAKMLYEFDCEMDPVSLVQSLLLMTYWYETPYDHKDSMHWLSIAISLAYAVGIHKNQENSGLSLRKQRLWKRLWWSCFMRDRLMLLGTRGTARIDEASFDVRMLTMDDFEIQSLDDDNLTVSSECIAVREIRFQRDLAALCIAKAKLCLFVSHALITQSSALGHRRRTAQGQEGNAHSCHIPSNERPYWIENENCYHGLTEWAKNLPIQCRYQAPIPSDVESGRSCVIVHRALLHMFYSTVVLAIQKRQFLAAEATTHKSSYSTSQYIADRRLYLAADQITSISKDLIGLKLEQYLPTSGVTFILYAISVHVLDTRSPNGMKRQKALSGFSDCMTVMESLRASYASADYACRILYVAKQQIHLDATRTNTSKYQDGMEAIGISISKQHGSIAPQFSSHDIDIEQHLETAIPDHTSTQGIFAPLKRAAERKNLENFEASQSEPVSSSMGNDMNFSNIAIPSTLGLPNCKYITPASEFDTVFGMESYIDECS